MSLFRYKEIILLFLILFPLSLSALVIEDIKDKNADWECFSDKVMGGVSEGSFSVKEEAYVRLEGVVRTENNGGFIQCRAKVNLKTKGFEGIRIKAKGNNNEYYIHLRAPRMLPWNYYSAKFYASEEWKVIDLPLSSFEYSKDSSKSFNSSKLSTVALVAFGKDFDAQLDLSKLEIY